MELSKQQQLEFLFSIVTEASKWEKSSGDDRDSIRMEVEERIASLLRGGEVIKDGRIQSVLCPDPSPSETEQPQETEEAPVRTKSIKSKEWMKGRVHVKFDDGQYHWCKAEHCEKVPRPTQPYLSKWSIKDEFKDLYK